MCLFYSFHNCCIFHWCTQDLGDNPNFVKILNLKLIIAAIVANQILKMSKEKHWYQQRVAVGEAAS